MSENCKSLVLQDKCNIEIVLSLTSSDSFPSLFGWWWLWGLPTIDMVVLDVIIKQVLLAETFATVLKRTLVLVVVRLDHKCFLGYRHNVATCKGYHIEWFYNLTNLKD